MSHQRRACGLGVVCLGAVKGVLVCLSLCLVLAPVWGAEALRVGVYQNSPKVAFIDGKAEGIFVDLLQGIARQEGWELEFVPGTWAEGLQRLAFGPCLAQPGGQHDQVADAAGAQQLGLRSRPLGQATATQRDRSGDQGDRRQLAAA